MGPLVTIETIKSIAWAYNNLRIRNKPMPMLHVSAQTFVMDGNFSAVHQHRENPHHNVRLTHGEFFMTEPSNYKAHIAIAQEVKEVHQFFFVLCFMQISLP
jgi:hypothetical protein